MRLIPARNFISMSHLYKLGEEKMKLNSHLVLFFTIFVFVVDIKIILVRLLAMTCPLKFFFFVRRKFRSLKYKVCRGD